MKKNLSFESLEKILLCSQGQGPLPVVTSGPINPMGNILNQPVSTLQIQKNGQYIGPYSPGASVVDDPSNPVGDFTNPNPNGTQLI